MASYLCRQVSYPCILTPLEGKVEIFTFAYEVVSNLWKVTNKTCNSMTSKINMRQL